MRISHTNYNSTTIVSILVPAVQQHSQSSISVIKFYVHPCNRKFSKNLVVFFYYYGCNQSVSNTTSKVQLPLNSVRYRYLFIYPFARRLMEEEIPVKQLGPNNANLIITQQLSLIEKNQAYNWIQVER